MAAAAFNPYDYKRHLLLGILCFRASVDSKKFAATLGKKRKLSRELGVRSSLSARFSYVTNCDSK